jgi:hypothetical protein
MLVPRSMVALLGRWRTSYCEGGSINKGSVVSSVVVPVLDKDISVREAKS